MDEEDNEFTIAGYIQSQNNLYYVTLLFAGMYAPITQLPNTVELLNIFFSSNYENSSHSLFYNTTAVFII